MFAIQKKHLPYGIQLLCMTSVLRFMAEPGLASARYGAILVDAGNSSELWQCTFRLGSTAHCTCTRFTCYRASYMSVLGEMGQLAYAGRMILCIHIASFSDG